MKKTLLIFLGLVSTGASAQDFLSLNYFTEKNHFEFSGFYTNASSDYKVFDNAGNSLNQINERSNIISSKLAYGLKENIKIGLNLDLALDGSRNNFEYHGPSDLNAFAEYRVFTDGEFFIDSILGYQLSTARESRRNFQEGHDVITLGASLGQINNFHEWRMDGELKYHAWGRTSEGRNNPYANFNLLTKYQYTGIKKWALGLGMDWKYLGEKTLKTDSLITVIDTDSVLGFNTFAKYFLSDDVVIEAAYRILMRYELDSEAGALVTKTKYREASSCYLGAKVKF